MTVLKATFLKATFASVILTLFAGCSGLPEQATQPEIYQPELALKYVRQGQQSLELGRKNEAAEAWNRAVELNPADAITVNNLALLKSEQHLFPEATTLLKAGIDHAPDVAELHYNLAVIAELYLLDLELALKHYQRFRELSSEDSKLVGGWIADLQRRLN